MSVVPVTGDNTAWLWSVLALQLLWPAHHLLSFLHGENPALPSALNSAQGPSWLLQMHWEGQETIY